MKEDMGIPTQEDFNSEPVYYCAHCMSLHVLSDAGLDFCGQCGSTEIEELESDENQTAIEKWQEMYNKRFSCKRQ